MEMNRPSLDDLAVCGDRKILLWEMSLDQGFGLGLSLADVDDGVSHEDSLQLSNDASLVDLGQT